MNIKSILDSNIYLLWKVSKKVKNQDILNKVLDIYKDYIYFYNKDIRYKYNKENISSIYNEYKYKIDNL